MSKIIELYMENVDSIPKPLQRILMTWSIRNARWTLFPSLFIPATVCYLFFLLWEEFLVSWNNTVSNHSGLWYFRSFLGWCGLTRRFGAASGKGGKPIIKIRKPYLRRRQFCVVCCEVKKRCSTCRWELIAVPSNPKLGWLCHLEWSKLVR